MNDTHKPTKAICLKADSSTLTIVENFDFSVENMQKFVGGSLEAIELKYWEDGTEITLWLNEEGKLIPLPSNFALIHSHDNQLIDVIMGDVLITGCDPKGKTIGLTDEQIDFVQENFDMKRGLLLPPYIAKRTYYLE